MNVRSSGRLGEDESTLFHYVDSEASSRSVSVDAAASVAFETALLVRPIRNFKNQTNVVGHYWSSTTAHHIEYESYLESCWLTIFDFDTSISAMSAQPFRITGVVDGGVLDHVPDFFLRRGSAGVVVDVRHDELQDKKFDDQTRATRKVCERAGFAHETFGVPEVQRWTNIRFLAGYRRPLPPALDYEDQILHLATDPVTINELASFVDEPLIAKAVVLHLCWKQQLILDLDRPLGGHTMVATSRNA